MRIVTAALALALCGTLAAAAMAEKSSFDVQPSIKLKRVVEKDTFSGKLRSKSRACEANRKVKLLHRAVKQTAKWEVVTRLRTNGDGAWKYVATKNQNGDRYATPGNWHVKAGQTQAGGVSCLSSYSSSILVP